MESTNPRVAIYYDVLPSTGMRNDGGPLYTFYNLKKLLGKENVLHLSPLGELTHFGSFDLHVLVDYGEDGLGIDLDWELRHPNAYWVSDAHITPEGYKYRLERAKQFDYVFCAQKRCLEEFKRDGIPKEKLFWLPHAFEPDVYKPMGQIERYDWAFVGYMNSPQRIDLLDRLLKEFPKAYIGWRYGEIKGHNVFEDACKKYNNAKFVPNITITDDISMRIFEVLGSKRCLLTNLIPTLPDILEPGKHLMAYKTMDEAIAMARDLIQNKELRDAIAEDGYHEVMSKHTYMHRALSMLKTTLQIEPELTKGELTPC